MDACVCKSGFLGVVCMYVCREVQGGDRVKEKEGMGMNPFAAMLTRQSLIRRAHGGTEW